MPPSLTAGRAAFEIHVVFQAVNHAGLHDALVFLEAEAPEVRPAPYAGADVPDAPVPQRIGHAREKPVAGPVNDHTVELGRRALRAVVRPPGCAEMHHHQLSRARVSPHHLVHQSLALKLLLRCADKAATMPVVHSE